MLKEGAQNRRPAFSTEWLKNRILAPNALAGLNAEARCVLLAMINTGARPSEIINLVGNNIVLDSPIPHIRIRPEGRNLKSNNAQRDIPLLGVSLQAMREFPEGFPRYFDSLSFSATANAFLAKNGLKETEEHVVYSIRHSFEDRLRKANVDDRIRAELFGHSFHRVKYGATGLDELKEAVALIAL